MIITLSGYPGSGKTTIAKEVAKALGYKHYSMGDLRGEIALKRGLTIDELNELGKKEDWTDKEVDEYQKELGKKQDNFVVDGWLSFYFIPHSIKIFLYVDLKEGAKRIFKDQREDEEKKGSIGEVLKMIKKRLDDSRKRYLKYYKVKFDDKKHYDLWLDTTRLTKDLVVDKLIKYIKSRQN